jgi:hypothetical protein
MAKVRNIRIGREDVSPSAAAHTPGVRRGHSKSAYASESGHLADGRSTARRSTGINPDLHDPIDPRMPNLSPA